MLALFFVFFVLNRMSYRHKFFISLICLGLIIYPHASFLVAQNTLSRADQEAQWRAELEQTEKDIAKWQSILDSTKANTKSLQQEAAILNAKIKQAQAFIKQRNIAIAQLGKDIEKKTETIKDLEEKIEKGHESLAQLIRKTDEIDNYSLVEVMLTNQDLSDFFSDVDSFQMIKRSMHELFTEIRQTKNITEQERAELDKKKIKEMDTKVQVEAQKREVERNEKEKQYLIQVNKTQEKTYEQVLAERRKRAAEIRAALFALRDSASIPFGDALTYAQKVEKATGVRPAFLLAILTQESNLGKNVGTCNRKNDPPEKGWRKIMPGPEQIAAKLSRRDDQSAFLRITSALGLDPDTTPLSCPLASGGWGGAMGPSQFIPTTWEAYAPKVEKALGKSVVSPWNPEDAFMAAGIYLSELGASKGGYTAERTAALKYYAGSNWNRSSNAFYGNQVMAKANNIQETMIDPLANL